MAENENRKPETGKLQDVPVKKDASAKKAGSHNADKKPNIFKRIGRGLKKWVKELRSEAKKVSWPSFKQVVNNTLAVLAFVVVVGALVIVADLVFRNSLELFLSIF